MIPTGSFVGPTQAKEGQLSNMYQLSLTNQRCITENVLQTKLDAQCATELTLTTVDVFEL